MNWNEKSGFEWENQCMIHKEDLYGGRKGKISKEEDKVIRPGNKWTPHVQSFLSFMHENGFDNIPKPYGINESGMEMVSFADGTVYNDNLPMIIFFHFYLAGSRRTCYNKKNICSCKKQRGISFYEKGRIIYFIQQKV